MTYFKHVLARKRIMIYTHPAAELACAMSIIGAEMCFGHGSVHTSDAPTVFGMVGLMDMARLAAEGAKGNGWIACRPFSSFFWICGTHSELQAQQIAYSKKSRIYTTFSSTLQHPRTHGYPDPFHIHLVTPTMRPKTILAYSKFASLSAISRSGPNWTRSYSTVLHKPKPRPFLTCTKNSASCVQGYGWEICPGVSEVVSGWMEMTIS